MFTSRGRAVSPDQVVFVIGVPAGLRSRPEVAVPPGRRLDVEILAGAVTGSSVRRRPPGSRRRALCG